MTPGWETVTKAFGSVGPNFGFTKVLGTTHFFPHVLHFLPYCLQRF